MVGKAVLLLALGVVAVHAVPERACGPGIVFVADHEDLCRYHWCTGMDAPIPWLCPPGARVPTWFETSPTDRVIPCTIDHSTDTTCLRCDYDDVREPDDRDDCANNPCPSNCQCQDLYQDYHCLCPGDVVPGVVTVDRETFFCDNQPCQNGATCFSQWDDYWCECPRGYTGKNCEVPFCGPDTCFNGGTCTVDAINYHCECTQCFDGPCCENSIPGCTGIVNPGGGTRPTPKYNPPPTAPPTVRPIAPCNNCQHGDKCQFTKDWLCSCNSCDGGQICYDREQPYPRECLGTPGPYGSQYTLTFSQDTYGGSQYKRVYINVGGQTLTGSHQVRYYTPNIRSGEPCYVDRTVAISLNEPAYYDVPAECLNTESGSVESKKVLKVLHTQGQQIVVTVGNMDGDGYLAIPDSMAGDYFVSHSYSKSGADQFITVVALTDNTQVLIQKPDVEVFNIPGIISNSSPQSNVETYNLQALQSVRYVVAGSDGDLLGTVVVSNNDIHVWSGNMDSASQKSQEQLAAVTRWGPGNVDEYVYIIVAVADNTLNTRDEVHAEAAVATDFVMYLIDADGVRTVLETGSYAANSMNILGPLDPGQICEFVTTQPVQVTHNIVGENSNGQSFYSAYALIPSIQQFASSYSFQTHGSRGGVGGDFMHHYLTLVSMRGALQDSPDYFEQIVIYHHNPATGVTTTYTPADLGARWVLVTGFYYGVRIELPSTGIYYLSNPSLDNYEFGAIYYGISGDRRSVQPNTAFPLGCQLDRTNNIAKPNICPRCTAGANCNIPIIHTCACNPCPNFDDICANSANPNNARTCTSIVDTTGNPFTIMFMQNRPDNTPKRELEIYATPAGTASQTIRVFTPYLAANHKCYLDTQRQVNGFEVALFNIPNPDCYETIGSGTFNDKAIRVQSEGGDLLVYAVNRDEFSADGWVAFPDGAAGRDFYAICHSPAVYGTEFAVLNIQDVAVTITITYTSSASPDLTGTSFTLQPGEVLQIQSQIAKSDLTGTRIQSDRPVNVYSGNIRAKVEIVEDSSVGNINTGSRDHLVEQLMPVTRWGTVFHIQPIPDRRFGDQIKVVGSESGTNCAIHRRRPNGVESEEGFNLQSGSYFTRDVISDNTYRIICNRRVFVAQITKSQERGFNIHDPSLITVPPVEQYTNRYIFNTPSFSGGSGTKRPYEFRLILISARSEDRDGIMIIHSGTERSVSDMGTWRKVPGTDYYNIVAELEDGTSLILHRSDSVNFMCIFYGYDDRESLGFPIGMKLQVIESRDLLSSSSN